MTERHLSPNGQVSPSYRDPSPTAEDTRIARRPRTIGKCHKRALNRKSRHVVRGRGPGTCLCQQKDSYRTSPFLFRIRPSALHSIHNFPFFFYVFMIERLRCRALDYISVNFSSFRTPFSFVNVAHSTGSNASCSRLWPNFCHRTRTCRMR